MWRLPRKTSIGFFSALGLMILVGVVTYLSLLRYFSSRAEQAQARETLVEATRVEKNLVDAETGQRGYLLTGDVKYLEPYRNALENVPRSLGRLDVLLKDDGQRARLERLKTASASKLAELAQTIDLTKQGKNAEALAIVKSDAGKQSMDESRRALGAIQDAQEEVIASRSASDSRRALITSVTSALGNLIALAIILVALYFINREFVRRDVLEHKLADSNAELEAFAYSVAHDLKAPLRAITGFAQAVHEDYADKIDDDGRRYLDSIRGNARRMAQLIEDLLAYSRLGRTEANPVVFDIGEMFHSALEELTQGDETRMARVAIASGMPRVRADKMMMKQAALNLLSNAIKFSAARPEPHVDVAFREDGGNYVFQVSDNGVGFDMKYAENLFGVFQRLHRREDFDGTGVGLAIVKRALRRNGGDVWAESQPDQGAKFSFTLPKPGAET